MFGFLKKKKKDKDAPEKESKGNQDSQSPGQTADNESEQDSGKSAQPVKKKRSIIKIILILVLSLIAVGASAFTVYKLWFSASSTDGQTTVYIKIQLSHVNLPEEMLKFSFDHYSDLYAAMIEFNREINLFEKEIDRIEQIAATYPDQKKIAEKEKKIWVKAKDTLKKSFLKIEKPIKETYVQLRVNEELGLIQIKETNKELTQIAREALIPAQKMTEKLKLQEVVPEGLIQGTLYKLKKKFL